MKFDNLKLGLIIGIVAPIFGVFGMYLWKFHVAGSFWDFLIFLGVERQLITSIISVSLVANAATFTYFINSRKDQTAKGIFIITIIYVVAALVLKFMYS